MTAANAPVGPCDGCGVPTVGEHLTGSIWLFSCPSCNAEADADWDATMSRFRDLFGKDL